jgi:hypothetical protein
MEITEDKMIEDIIKIVKNNSDNHYIILRNILYVYILINKFSEYDDIIGCIIENLKNHFRDVYDIINIYVCSSDNIRISIDILFMCNNERRSLSLILVYSMYNTIELKYGIYDLVFFISIKKLLK